MFARTKRLLLRPGWMEDASALAAALADERIAQETARIPTPYTLDHARDFLSQPQRPGQPCLLIFERGDAAPILVGGIGLNERSGRMEIGYWIHPDHWGRGFATEAGHAMVAIADMLGHDDLHATFFLDNPASGAVLQKLGFVATGDVGLCTSPGRADPALCRTMRRKNVTTPAIPAPIAA